MTFVIKFYDVATALTALLPIIGAIIKLRTKDHIVQMTTIATIFGVTSAMVSTPISTAAIFRVPIPNDITILSARLSPNPK